jgi:hypothetical protein
MLVAYDGSTEARGAVAGAGELAAPGDLVGVVNVMPEPGVSSRLAPHVDERRHQARLLDGIALRSGRDRRRPPRDRRRSKPRSREPVVTGA